MELPGNLLAGPRIFVPNLPSTCPAQQIEQPRPVGGAEHGLRSCRGPNDLTVRAADPGRTVCDSRSVSRDDGGLPRSGRSFLNRSRALHDLAHLHGSMTGGPQPVRSRIRMPSCPQRGKRATKRTPGGATRSRQAATGRRSSRPQNTPAPWSRRPPHGTRPGAWNSGGPTGIMAIVQTEYGIRRNATSGGTWRARRTIACSRSC